MKLQLGPLFWFEFLRQSRQSSGHWARLTYTGIFLFILYIVFGQGEITAGQMPKLAEECATGYVTLQYLAVMILTPVFIVSSIIEDRHKRVFEILLTTYLSAREILLGKLFSRLLHVLIVLASGIPVLALLQILGGVNMPFVLWHTCMALFMLLVVGCLAIRASLWASTTLTGILFTWLILLPGIGFVFVPGYFVGYLLEGVIYLSPWIMGLTLMLLFDALIAARLMRDAFRALDRRIPTLLELEKLSHPRPGRVTETTHDEAGRQLDARRLAREVRLRREHFSYHITKLGDAPLRWMEENFPPFEWGYWMPVAYLILPSLLALSMSWEIVFFFFMKVVATYFLYMATVHIATSLSQDRAERRLETLFTLPYEPVHFFSERISGACLRYRHLLFDIVLGFCISTFMQPVHNWWMLPIILTQSLFWMAFGCWLGLQPLSTFVIRTLLGSIIVLSSLAGFYCFDTLGFQLLSMPSWIQLVIGQICPWGVLSTVQHYGEQMRPQVSQTTVGVWALTMSFLNLILACLFFWLTLACSKRLFRRGV